MYENYERGVAGNAVQTVQNIPTPRTTSSFHYLQFINISFFNYNEEEREKIGRAVKYAVVGAAIVALFVATICLHLPTTQLGQQQSGALRVDKQGRTVRSACSFGLPPNLECSGLDLTDGPEPLLAELRKLYAQGVSKINLILRNTEFANNKTESDWIILTEDCPEIKSLTLDAPNLVALGDDSFINLKDLESITLANSKITYLSIQAFKGLKKIWEFSLKSNPVLKTVESGLLREFALSTFQLEGMILTDQQHAEIFFQNLTGGKDLSTVQILDLRQNIIPTFFKSIIQPFSGAISIYLMQNAIETFEKASFSAAKQLQQLYISTNEIQTLQEETFAFVLKERLAKLYLKNNPLQCDCELEWIQNWTISNNLTDGDLQTVVCKTPRNLEDVLLIKADLCPEGPPLTTPQEQTTTSTTTTPQEQTTTPKEQTTTSTITTTSITPPPPPQKISCTDAVQLYQLIAPIATFTNTGKFAKFSLTDVENSENVQLNIFDDDPFQLAFSCGTCHEISCQILEQDAQNRITIQGLQPSTLYLFCLFSENLDYFHECVPYKTLPSLGQRPWITNDSKSLMISYICLGLLAIFLVGGFVTFLIVRRKPTLLKGSGRVEVVKSRDGNLVLVMPENRKISMGSPNSVYDTISGYISVSSTPGSCSPPPLPPYPPSWYSKKRDDYEYLEPNRLPNCRLPRNMDLLLEYEWYTSQHNRPDSRSSSR